MNEFLYRTTPGNKYATFFYAQVDGDRRQLRYVNAGHNPPYLVRARHDAAAATGNDTPVEELTTGGAVVGMLPGMSYEEATVDLCSGDVLLAYTDGVTEAHNPEHVEFGEERLKTLLSEVAHLSADDIRDAHLDRVERLDQGRRAVRRPHVRRDEGALTTRVQLVRIPAYRVSRSGTLGRVLPL